MDEYISREETVKAFCEKCKGYYDGHCIHRGECDIDVIQTTPAADVQPLSVVAEHIKNRLYETAYNTTEEKARNAIADMAGRIDFWIDELKDGDAERENLNRAIQETQNTVHTKETLCYMEFG